MNELKNRFPFRLGTTSYIIPADIVPNVEYLAETVDDIELVLFESDEISNLPDRQTIEKLYRLARKHGLTYTVHFPLDTYLGDLDEEDRKRSVAKCRRIMDLTSPLDPFAYIVHCSQDHYDQTVPWEEDRWQEQVHRSLSTLTSHGASSTLFCIETLRYPFYVLEDILSALDLAVCLDVGHLLLNDYSVEKHIDKYLERTRVVHLHGIVDGNDHHTIKDFPDHDLNALMTALRKDTLERVVTLELFNKSDLKTSLERLEQYQL